MSFTVSILQSEYFLIPKKRPKYSLGQLVKITVNPDKNYDDACLIEGIRIHLAKHLYLYRLQYLTSLSRWYKNQEFKLKPGDSFEATEKVLLPLNARDKARLERSYVNTLKAQDSIL